MSDERVTPREPRPEHPLGEPFSAEDERILDEVTRELAAESGSEWQLPKEIVDDGRYDAEELAWARENGIQIVKPDLTRQFAEHFRRRGYAEHYDRREDEHWITLEPSGTHVKIDGSGNIVAGPDALGAKLAGSSEKENSDKPIDLHNERGKIAGSEEKRPPEAGTSAATSSSEKENKTMSSLAENGLVDMGLTPRPSHNSKYPEKTLGEWIDDARHAGVSQADIDLVLAGYPAARQPIYWEHNVAQAPRRAIDRAKEVIERKASEKKANGWSINDLRSEVRKHREGELADSDKLAEAVRRGLIGMSAAMNQDF